MKLRQTAVIGMIALTMGATSSRASAETSLQPHQYTLALHRLQDQIVEGDKLAHAAQREMLVLMAGEFAKIRIADWQKKRNAEALLIYMLSGGNPDIVDELLSIKNKPNLPDGVLSGALEFVLGNYSQAKKLLKPIKADDMSINAGAQVALVKATLYAGEDPEKAFTLLAKIRLWKPGTLLEEAALRRAVALAGARKDRKRFLMWSSQYTRRFEKSFYVPDFIAKFSYYVTELDFSSKPERMKKVVHVLSHLSKIQQASVYLTVARAAVVSGNNKQAEFMARKAQELLKNRPGYSARAMLYLAASQVASKHQREAIALLTKIDKSLLETKDQKIYDTVRLMIEVIQKKPQQQAGQIKETAMADHNRKPGERQGGQTSAVVARVQKLIKNANKLLEANK